MSWSSAFDDPIPLPRGRHLVTRKDAEAVPGPHLVYGFLTTARNAVVEPIGQGNNASRYEERQRRVVQGF
jgi:hypothetical protein